jgi:hypothetical protein
MRSSEFVDYFSLLPENTFAPNVILSGLASRAELRIFQSPVDFQPRKAGESSLSSRRLLKGAWLAFIQTVSISLQIRKIER